MPRNHKLNQQMKDQRREKILAGALRLFAGKGLAATKITDIATVTEMSQGLIYHYYRSKEEIFTELIRHAFERMNEAVRELEKLPVPPEDKIRSAIEHLFEGLSTHENTGHYHLLIAQATASEAIPDKAKEIIRHQSGIPYEVMTRIIKEGQKQNTIKNYDAGELALVFWTSIKGLAIHKATHGKAFQLPDPEILMNMFF